MTKVLEIRPGVVAEADLGRLVGDALSALNKLTVQATADGDPMVGHYAALSLALRAQQELSAGLTTAMTDSRVIRDDQFAVLHFAVRDETKSGLALMRVEFLRTLRIGLWLGLAGVVLGAALIGGFAGFLIGVER